MSMTKGKYPRRSLGPDYTGMTCLMCGQAGLHGLLDVNGRPYVSCESCRFRALGLSLAGVASVRFFGDLLRTDALRAAWAKQVAAAMATATAPLQGTQPVAAEVVDVTAAAESETRRASA